MSNPIQQAFIRAADDGRTAIVPFVTVGHPQRDSTPAVVESLSDAGADVIELGIPFSDPLAEGPVIQKSSFRALENGITPEACFQNASEIRRRGVTAPLVFMGYYNPIYQIGLDEFCARTKDAGVDGIIAADPPCRRSGTAPRCLRKGRHLPRPAIGPHIHRRDYRSSLQTSIRLHLLRLLAWRHRGPRLSVKSRRNFSQTVQSYTELPVAVGFGISNAEHVREVGEFADGAVIGSALINSIQDNDPEHAPRSAARFLRSLNE